MKILDPYNFDVFLPSRYIDKALTAELIFITSPYSPKELYDNFQTSKRIDRFDQLERRIQTAILVEKDNIFYTHYNNESQGIRKDDSNFSRTPLSLSQYIVLIASSHSLKQLFKERNNNNELRTI